MTDLSTVLYSVHGSVALITMNRPGKRNALTGEMCEAFIARMDSAGRDDRVHSIVLTGAGDAAFIAGVDLYELSDRNPVLQQALIEGRTIFDAIEESSKPVIAAINGFCLGGGLELALACDLRFASEGATFAQPEVLMGLIPGGGATQRLPRIVGMGAALRLILTGATISAQRAEEINLVDEIVPSNVLIDHTMAVAQRIARLDPAAVSLAREATRSALGMPLAQGLKRERELFLQAFESQAAREGVRSYLRGRAGSPAAR
jgi:enoyl-CoA hydratase